LPFSAAFSPGNVAGRFQTAPGISFSSQICSSPFFMPDFSFPLPFSDSFIRLRFDTLFHFLLSRPPGAQADFSIDGRSAGLLSSSSASQDALTAALHTLQLHATALR
jgi:hypothetical protein